MTGEVKEGLSDAALAGALRGLVDGVVLLDRDVTIRWVNDRFRQLTGWSEDELVGRNGLELLDPVQLADALEAFTITSEQEVLPPGSYALAHRDGGYVLFEMHASPVDPDDEDSLIALMVRPIDHRYLLNDGIELLNAGGPIEDVASFVVERIGWSAGPMAVVFDDEAGGRRRSIHLGLPPLLAGELAVDDGPAPWDEAEASGEAVHRTIDELPPSLAAAARDQGFVACTVEPVPDAGGRHALIILWFEAGAPLTYRFLFREEPRYLLLRLALERRHYLRALHTAATHDHLTGLANRHHFFDAIDRASSEMRCAVIYVDLDDFKPINDTHGHLMGDAVLTEIGNRLRHAVRATDIAARLGGDEFAVLCLDDVDEAAIDGLAERLHHAITAPIAMPEGAVRVGASVGAAVASKPGIPPVHLIDAADRNLYELKQLGKDGWRTTVVH